MGPAIVSAGQRMEGHVIILLVLSYILLKLLYKRLKVAHYLCASLGVIRNHNLSFNHKGNV